MGSLKQKTKEVVEAPLQRVLKKYTNADEQLGTKKEKAGTRPCQFDGHASQINLSDQHLNLSDQHLSFSDQHFRGRRHPVPATILAVASVAGTVITTVGAHVLVIP